MGKQVSSHFERKSAVLNNRVATKIIAVDNPTRYLAKRLCVQLKFPKMISAALPPDKFSNLLEKVNERSVGTITINRPGGDSQ
jgi:hypothetical protein